jgi:dihydrofolate reductase
MAGPDRIEGYAIVSADGMIADAFGVQPQALRIEADQKFFLSGLAKADAAAHGRNSYEGGPKQAHRRRLLLTHQIAALAPDTSNSNVMLWNPAGASLAQAWSALGLAGGALAVIGGTAVFGHFLELGYDVFHLTRQPNASFLGGRPVFPGVPARSPDDLLAGHGLAPDQPVPLDRKSGATLVTWRRR